MEISSSSLIITEYNGQILTIDDTIMFIFDKRRNKWIMFPAKSLEE